MTLCGSIKSETGDQQQAHPLCTPLYRYVLGHHPTHGRRGLACWVGLYIADNQGAVRIITHARGARARVDPRARARGQADPQTKFFIVLFYFLFLLCTHSSRFSRVWHAATPIATFLWSRWGNRFDECPVRGTRGHARRAMGPLYGAKQLI